MFCRKKLVLHGLGFLILQSGFCYTLSEPEFNFYAGDYLDYSSFDQEARDFINSPVLENGKLKDNNAACLAEIICVVGGEPRDELLKCYEETGHNTTLFEEFADKLCAEDPKTQELCVVPTNTNTCGKDFDNAACIFDVSIVYYDDESNNKCNEKKYE